MPDGTCKRQDSTLERYDDAKPILDAEYLAERNPKTYRFDVKLMPITQWLVTISMKCMIWPLPPPPRTPHWPCNMVLTEDRQPQGETSHSPQQYRKLGEQKKPAGRKPRGRRYNVPGLHVESSKDLPMKERTSLPSSHLFVHHNSDQIPPAPPGFLQTPNRHQTQTQKTAAKAVWRPAYVR